MARRLLAGIHARAEGIGPRAEPGMYRSSARATAHVIVPISRPRPRREMRRDSNEALASKSKSKIGAESAWGVTACFRAGMAFLSSA